MTVLNLQSENSKEYLLAAADQRGYFLGVGESETEGYGVLLNKAKAQQLIDHLTQFVTSEEN